MKLYGRIQGHLRMRWGNAPRRWVKGNRRYQKLVHRSVRRTDKLALRKESP